MLLLLNPTISKRGYLPNYLSIVNQIKQVYISYLGIITKKLYTTQSKIYLLFNLYSSRNLRALLGINCYFANKFSNLKTFLLSLLEQSSPYSSINITNNVTTIINYFNLIDKIGYFIIDNVTNNDTYIEALRIEFGFNLLHRHLRYSSYKINLITRVMLQGVDEEAFENELTHVTIKD